MRIEQNDKLKTFCPPALTRIEADIKFGEATLSEIQEGALSMLDELPLYSNPQAVLEFIELILAL